MNQILYKEFKCGEIYFSKSLVYIFVCCYCENKFDDIQTFQNHCEIFHLESSNMKSENEVNVENKTYEVVIEKYSISSEDYSEYTENNISRNNEIIGNDEKEEDNYRKISENHFQDNEVLITNMEEKFYNDSIMKKLDEQNDKSKQNQNKICESELIEHVIYCSHCDYQFKHFENHDEQNCWNIQKIIKKYRYKNHKYNYDALQFKGIFLCKNCPRYFDNIVELTSHERSHCSIPPIAVCKKKLVSNLKTQHSNKAKSNMKTSSNKLFQCGYCSRQFIKSTAFLKHELSHERSKCEYCGKHLKSVDKFADHLRTHTGDRPFKCTKCPAAFAIKRNLSTHFIYKHTDDKPFKCRDENGCAKFFKTKHLRNLHEKRHSQNVEFQCEICGANFNVKAKLRDHFKRKHLDYSQRPHSCSICDKKFVDKQQLREHERTHTGEKPLKCDKCSSSFAKLSSLREHKKLHTGEKSHICKICGKAFVQFAGYWSHMKNHP